MKRCRVGNVRSHTSCQGSCACPLRQPPFSRTERHMHYYTIRTLGHTSNIDTCSTETSLFDNGHLGTVARRSTCRGNPTGPRPNYKVIIVVLAVGNGGRRHAHRACSRLSSSQEGKGGCGWSSELGALEQQGRSGGRRRSAADGTMWLLRHVFGKGSSRKVGVDSGKGGSSVAEAMPCCHDDHSEQSSLLLHAFIVITMDDIA